MKTRSAKIVLWGCLLGFGLLSIATEAAIPLWTTTISVKLDNEKCVSRIVESLREVPNVAEARADLQKGTATVTPSVLRQPSPRALWEAVEKTGHAVVQMQGPRGKFTSKPEN